jgi:hypothetical protein
MLDQKRCTNNNPTDTEMRQLLQQTSSKPEAPDPNHQPLRLAHFQRVGVFCVK